ncbi:hypothetical protein DSL72_000772 [Monilinia vaccinii-corymbosi]|uniref:Glycoside hydrolase family 17 protein n=1 Tax=Monilinia vaccinii-corymbosi TaxID=61207 RepID=A0A8A3P9R5_9HELO|nr:hypothetical protein DSL72_000772 [Monilinia vaccinii-corymbosi]
MKTTTLSLAALSLLQLTLAQPHVGRHNAHRALHEKRDLGTVVDTAVVEARAPDVVGYPPAASTPVPNPQAGFGFSYTPYLANKQCKTQEQVNHDFAAIPPGFSTVRIYGPDCNQVRTTMVAAKKYGFKIFAGVYHFDKVAAETQVIVDAVQGDWSLITMISIGNEWVNNGITDPAGVASAVATARAILTAAGYHGKIVAVDTLAAARAHPELCENVPQCVLNCHPFFDTHTAAEGAGEFIVTQIAELRKLLSNPNIDILISETGWPSSGISHDKAVASPEAQKAAIESIKKSFASNPSGVVLFSTFNEFWKNNNPQLFNAENSWGFLGHAPSDVAAGLIV